MNEKIYKQIKNIGERLKKEYNAQKVILFGSYASWTATEDSDIDILIIAPTNEKFFKRMATVRRLIRNLRNGTPISPIVLIPEEIREKTKAKDQFIIDILDKGVIL